MNSDRIRRISKTCIKTALWIVGVIIALLITVQIILSPRVLTPFIEKIADQYMDASVHFGQVSVNMFRNFPNISVTIDSCRITYGSERFARYVNDENASKAARIGSFRGDTSLTEASGRQDTLATLAKFRASVNPFALLDNQLRIKHIFITDLKGFAHRFDTNAVNWDIFRIPEKEDTVQTEKNDSLPIPVIGRITLDGRPTVLYSDAVLNATALATFSTFDFKGNRDSGQPLFRDFKMEMDSLFLYGRLGGDTMAVVVNEIELNSHGEKAVEGLIKTRFFASDDIHGRIGLPLELSFDVDIPDSLDRITVNSFTGNVCDIPFDVKGDFHFLGDSIRLTASVDITRGEIGKAAADIGAKIIPILDKIRTDATLDLHLHADGLLVPKEKILPEFTFSLSIPESKITVDTVEMGQLSLECSAKNSPKGKLDISLDTISATTVNGTHLAASGKISDLLGKDPTLKVMADLYTNLTPWSNIFGSDTSFVFSGRLSGKAGGEARFSQLNPNGLWSSELGAWFVAEDVMFTLPKDSIDIRTDSLQVIFGNGKNRILEDIEKGNRAVMAEIRIDTAFVKLGREAEIAASKLKIHAHSDASLLSGKTTLYGKIPIYQAEISASRLSLMDSDSTKITLRGSNNVFSLKNKEGSDTIPVISLSSQNQRFRLHGRSGRINVRDFGVSITAEKRTAFNPGGKGRGSAGQRRGQTKVIQEDDFTSQDYDFSLGESFKKFYKLWSAHGNATLEKASVKSPFFPLKSEVNGFGLSFSTNSITLKNISLKTGNTQMSVNGHISGLRRALTSNGIVTAELNLASEGMDINELLAAIAVGSANTDTTVEDENHETETLTSEEVEKEAENMKTPLIVVPGNVEATVNLACRSIAVSDMQIDSLSTVIEMKNRCLRISHIRAGSNIGDLSFEGFYATRSKKDIAAGINLGLSKVTAADVIDLIPSVDTLIPLLRTFNGELNCYVAGAAQLDTNMNLLPASTSGVLRFTGEHLYLEQTPEIKKITRLLMFKNKQEFNVDSMSVEAQLSDSRLELFPFILKIDRYTLAASGITNLDKSCDYHVSVMKSPLPFRLGLDIYGNDFSDLHYRLVKPKYKSEDHVPVFSETIDETRLNMSKMIENIFSMGVEKIVNDTAFMNVLSDRKKAMSYKPVQDTKSEEISGSEISRMEQEAAKNEDDK